jgi:hypothetical protein
MQHDPQSKELALKICEMMSEAGVPLATGCAALASVMCSGLIDYVSKEHAVEMFEQAWDLVESERRKMMPRGEDYTFELAPGVEAKISSDPQAAAMMRDMTAKLREAMDGLATGRFSTMDEAMRSIGGVKVDLDDDDLDDDDG